MTEREIYSLIYLLNDPDEDIFKHVQSKLLEIGTEAITPLERAWALTDDDLQHERIVDLVQEIQRKQVLQDLELWVKSGSFDLLQGLIIVNKYAYPNTDDHYIVQQIETIKKEIWLQMSYSMTPVEKVRLFNNVFYSTFGFHGNIGNYRDPQNSYLSRVLESKKGNPVLLGSIYMIIAQKLDMPVYGVNLPQHFVLAYTDNLESNAEENEVLFYINAFNKGQIFGKQDVTSFLNQLKLPPLPEYFLTCTNIEIIERVLRNISSYYESADVPTKVADLHRMIDILNGRRDG